MAQHVLLNNIDHARLRVIAARGAAYGDAVMHAVTFPTELRNVQACYPIVFQKTADGSFQPLALFGFTPGQNLFLDGERWDAPYIPLAIERQPFLIGRSDEELVMHVDLDSPRIGTDTGEPLFLPHGGTSEFLERMNSVLRALHEGLQATPAFIDALLAHDLLESFVLDIQLDDAPVAHVTRIHPSAESPRASWPKATLEPGKSLELAVNLPALTTGAWRITAGYCRNTPRQLAAAPVIDLAVDFDATTTEVTRVSVRCPL